MNGDKWPNQWLLRVLNGRPLHNWYLCSRQSKQYQSWAKEYVKGCVYAKFAAPADVFSFAEANDIVPEFDCFAVEADHEGNLTGVEHAYTREGAAMV